MEIDKYPDDEYNPHLAIPEMSVNDYKRLYTKIKIAGDDECWLWLGCRDQDGYGRFRLKHISAIRVPRLIYKIQFDVDPGPFKVCHTCDNPPCVNPNHLFLGDDSINLKDCYQKGRRNKGVRLPKIAR